VISTRVKNIAKRAGVERLSELRPGFYCVGKPNLGSIVERCGSGWLVSSTRSQSVARTLTRAFEVAQRYADTVEAIAAEADAMTDAELHEAVRTPGLDYTLRQYVIAARIKRGIDRQPRSRVEPTR
jgi:hypothetical protein